jgi:protein tyrosine/serine phosphatase
MIAYQPLVEASGYLVMISKILKSVNQVVETMMNRKLNVLIHCSDGWDRTAQMCALA